MANYETKRVLITVRTYPTPSQKDVEVSCTAGITADGDWIRLFPVPYRFLDTDKRFRKYQEIEVAVTKAKNDPRPESYHLDVDSIVVVDEPLPTKGPGWPLRSERIMPSLAHCMCCLQRQQKENGAPTLGFFKPAEIKRFEIKEIEPDWTAPELAKLQQQTLWEKTPQQELEKIPYDFFYHFSCPHDDCNGHRQKCTDWEMGESYRSWHDKYGEATWEEKFRQKFEHEMMNLNDTHFYAGTMHGHPNSWIIIGLWYPRLPKELQTA